MNHSIQRLTISAASLGWISGGLAMARRTAPSHSRSEERAHVFGLKAGSIGLGDILADIAEVETEVVLRRGVSLRRNRERVRAA
jgi:hypothetical protein